jgi:hypothetical protein
MAAINLIHHPQSNRDQRRGLAFLRHGPIGLSDVQTETWHEETS